MRREVTSQVDPVKLKVKKEDNFSITQQQQQQQQQQQHDIFV